MVDEYWIVLRGPRFKWLSWPKKTTTFNKTCKYEDISSFIDNLRKAHPDWSIQIGITRGNDIIIIP